VVPPECREVLDGRSGRPSRVVVNPAHRDRTRYHHFSGGSERATSDSARIFCGAERSSTGHHYVCQTSWLNFKRARGDHNGGALAVWHLPRLSPLAPLPQSAEGLDCRGSLAIGAPSEPYPQLTLPTADFIDHGRRNCFSSPSTTSILRGVARLRRDLSFWPSYRWARKKPVKYYYRTTLSSYRVPRRAYAPPRNHSEKWMSLPLFLLGQIFLLECLDIEIFTRYLLAFFGPLLQGPM
jgi:hypothetical protein